MGCIEEYIPTEWVNGTAPAINSSNLNHIEQGIKAVTEGCIENTLELQGGGVVPIGGIIMWSGSVVPANYALCDGDNGTPDLRGMFLRGASTESDIGDTGGFSEAQLPEHSHGMDHSHVGNTNTTGAHRHKIDHVKDAACGGCESTHTPGGTGIDAGVSTEGNHSHTVSISRTSGLVTESAGTNTSEGNLPPYYTVAFVMRIS